MTWRKPKPHRHLGVGAEPERELHRLEYTGHLRETALLPLGISGERRRLQASTLHWCIEKDTLCQKPGPSSR